MMPPFEYWYRGVAYERGYYHPGTGLLARPRQDFQEHEHIQSGPKAGAIMTDDLTAECRGVLAPLRSPVDRAGAASLGIGRCKWCQRCSASYINCCRIEI